MTMRRAGAILSIAVAGAFALAVANAEDYQPGEAGGVGEDGGRIDALTMQLLDDESAHMV